MFYEESKIKSLLICKKCSLPLDLPKILPCGVNLCNSCALSTSVVDQKFECEVCGKEHEMPKEGLPISEALSNLLMFEPSVLSRGSVAKTLQNQLDIVQKNIDFLTFSIDNGIDKIKEECYNLKSEVQLSTERIIQEVNEVNEKSIQKINKYEEECIHEFGSKKKEKIEFYDFVKALKVYHTEWTDYLKQFKLNENLMNEAIEEGKQLDQKSTANKQKLENLLFNGRRMKFLKNNVIGDEILGRLEISSFDFDSVILTKDQHKSLIELCNFSSSNNWKLIYRGSRDGFLSNEFHNRCNGKIKTLVVIKSSNSYIFGGYTEQDWTGNGAYKIDPNAFLFSLINASNIPRLFKCNINHNAIYSHISYGPTFGAGNDIMIPNNCTVYNSCSTNPSSYPIPSNNYLAGTNLFTVADIEVFQRE